MVLVLGVVSFGVGSASAAGTPAFAVHAVPEPSSFSAGDAATCSSEEKCDRYQILVRNAGDAASAGPVTLTDTLPAGVTFREVNNQINASGINGAGEGESWECAASEDPGGRSVVTCSFSESLPVGSYTPDLDILVNAPAVGVLGPLRNEVSVTGGGARAAASASEETPVSAQAPPFGVNEFSVEPTAADGTSLLGAGAHPWELTTSIGFPLLIFKAEREGHEFVPAEEVKDIAVELPLGFTGDPLATAQRCTQTELQETQGPNANGTGAAVNDCPAGSRVGTLAFLGLSTGGVYSISGGGNMTGIYNMVPEGGHAAEFAFRADGVPVSLYGSVVHTASGYVQRVTTPGLPELVRTNDVWLTFFGDPGQVDGGASEPAFLTNPVDCSTGGLSSRVEAESYEDPGHPVSRESVTYPTLTGCGLLAFDPSLSFGPSVGEGGTTQADEPSGYTTVLKVPQTSAFSELATPEVKNVSVTLPEGVALSPSSADGLQGCTEAQIELDSTTPGGCPLASQIGTVEAVTPILSEPLQGRVYLAQPKCGGEGQPACTAASASNGELYGLYVEVQGPGFTVKFPSVASVDPVTGRVTARFEDLIQQPISEFKLHLKSGPRAPLANPQSCGAASTVSDLTPWSSPVTPDAVGSSSFNVDWDGNGGACPAGMPFSPGFSAGTVSPVGGAFSAFSLTVSRHDREQDLSGLSLTMPPGLLGRLAGIPLCGEPQAAQGACSAGSQVGATTVAAGSGPHPFWTQGRVYLTGPYKGQPFGLSIVVPAQAGPFNLGDVVVRAAIHVDPNTAQITVTSDPVPQLLDGVPLRIQTVNVSIDREGFIFNPTNCSQLQLAGTITGAQGASVGVSSPFAATGCAGLPFHPVFSVSTQARTSKKSGASLTVKGAFPAGNANVRSVAVTLPKQLPARLTTIQQACPEATFNANPASCPAGSDIGVATATTPILANPVMGPAYLVSHGGAAFPNVVAILQGEGVTVDLTGSIDIKHGVTSSTFASVPDAPISSFQLTLPEGPHSGLAAVVPAKAKGSLCGQSLAMPFTITGQNGAQVKQDVKIAVTGCPKTKPKAKKEKARAKKRGKGGRK